MPLTDLQINAARVTVGRNIVERIISEPFMKTFLMLATPQQKRKTGTLIINTVAKLLEEWTPPAITETVLQLALDEYEHQARIIILMETGNLERTEAESLASYQALQRR